MKTVLDIASIAYKIEEVAKIYLNIMIHHINTILTIQSIASHRSWQQVKKKMLILKRKKEAARHRSKLLAKIPQVVKQM